MRDLRSSLIPALPVALLIGGALAALASPPARATGLLANAGPTIAAAGGYSPRAHQANVDITRTINGKVMTGRVVTSDPLMPGDTIYVRERLF